MNDRSMKLGPNAGVCPTCGGVTTRPYLSCNDCRRRRLGRSREERIADRTELAKHLQRDDVAGEARQVQSTNVVAGLRR